MTRRFADNPLVTGEPGIRFYAGVPISLESGLPRRGAVRVRQAPAPVSRARTSSGCGSSASSPTQRWRRTPRLCGQRRWRAMSPSRRSSCGRRTDCCAKSNASEKSADGSSTSSPTPATGRMKFHEFTSCRSAGSYQLEEALSFYPDEWRKLVERNIEKTLATGEPYNFEAQFVTGARQPEMGARRRRVRAAGRGAGAAVRHVPGHHAGEERPPSGCGQAANFDELTGLANRRHFNEKLGNAIEEAGNHRGAASRSCSSTSTTSRRSTTRAATTSATRS